MKIHNQILNKSFTQRSIIYHNNISNTATWNQLIKLIFKNQLQSHHYPLLKSIYQKMLNTSIPAFLKILKHAQTYFLQYIKNLQSFFLLLKYIITLESQIINISKFLNKYNSLVSDTKNGFYQQSISKLKGITYQSNNQIYQFIQIAVFVLPQFVKLGNLSIKFQSISNLLNWILIYNADTGQQIYQLNKFSKFLVDQCISEEDVSVSRARQELNKRKRRHQCLSILLNTIFQYSLFQYEGVANFFLIVNNLPQQSLETIIKTNQDKFIEFKPKQLVRIFQKLTNASVIPQIINLIFFISALLLKNQKFYALKIIYQQFILTTLLKYFKYSTLCQKQIQILIQFYVQGFLNSFQYSTQHIQNFICNFELIKKQDVQFYIQQVKIIGYVKKELKQIINEKLEKIKKGSSISLQQEKYNRLKEYMWNIKEGLNELSNKVIKKYKFIKNYKQKGIENRSQINCYIIVIIQSLMRTKSLKQLLLKYKKDIFSQSLVNKYTLSKTITIKSHFLYQILKIFQKLQDPQQKYISISQIKKKGPPSFRNSQTTHDCTQYLSALFIYLEKQFRDFTYPKLVLQNLKQIFQIIILNSIICPSCKNSSKSQQATYIHTLSFNQTLSEKYSNQLQQFTCQKCNSKSKKVIKNSTLIKVPEILILHIATFVYNSHSQQYQKLTYSQKSKNNIYKAIILKKQFKETHFLSVIIAHLGKSINSGHYIIYYRSEQNLKKWYLFDDQEVLEINEQLQDENEDIQKSFNLNHYCTPYLAFYKQRTIKSKKNDK